MARFLGNLGYTENVEVAVDNEPVLVAGMECCRDIRLRLGLSTTITTNKHYDKARASVAERMVQTVRNLQKTLILQLEESIGCRLPDGHRLKLLLEHDVSLISKLGNFSWENLARRNLPLEVSSSRLKFSVLIF